MFNSAKYMGSTLCKIEKHKYNGQFHAAAPRSWGSSRKSFDTARTDRETCSKRCSNYFSIERALRWRHMEDDKQSPCAVLAPFLWGHFPTVQGAVISARLRKLSVQVTNSKACLFPYTMGKCDWLHKLATKCQSQIRFWTLLFYLLHCSAQWICILTPLQ